MKKKLKKIILFVIDLSRLGQYKRIGLFQILSQYLAGLLSFALILVGCYYFYDSIKSYYFPVNACKFLSNSKPDFYVLIKGILSSFELFFMAPIPFLVIFSHRRNINQAFSDIRPVIQKTALDLDEIKAKKGFISSIIGILSTFILGIFFEYFSKNDEDRFVLFETNFWPCFMMVCLLFLFMIILILYYKLLSNHEDKNG